MGYKVLIAEDDAFLVSAYRVKLTKEGFDVRIAIDGEEALAVLRDFTPDLIMLDLIMPRRDGFSTLEEIKKIEALKNIPVIVASNLGQQGDVERAKALGAIDFVTKSDMAINDLITKITTIIEAHR